MTAELERPSHEPMRVDLRGRVVLVVGAGQTPGETLGLGRAASLCYARSGAAVIAADRDLDAAQLTVEEIEREGGSAEAVTLDVTEEADVEGVIKGCIERAGRIDILHNNVGISVSAGDGPLLALEASSFDQIIATNLRGMFLTCKHVVPAMILRGEGVITNVSSVAPHVANPLVAYPASKAGVEALTRNIAFAHARDGIRANCVQPGSIETPMSVETRIGLFGQTRREVTGARIGNIPMGRLGNAWDVAYAALFLASEEASYVTGIALTVDGGKRLNTAPPHG